MLSLNLAVSIIFMCAAELVDEFILRHKFPNFCVWLVAHRPWPFYDPEMLRLVKKDAEKYNAR